MWNSGTVRDELTKIISTIHTEDCYSSLIRGLEFESVKKSVASLVSIKTWRNSIWIGDITT